MNMGVSSVETIVQDAQAHVQLMCTFALHEKRQCYFVTDKL